MVSLRCQVDDRRGMSDRQFAKANAAYSFAVNRLMANPDRKVKIVVNNQAISVRARDVASGLIGAHVRAGPENPDARASTAGGALTPHLSRNGRPFILLSNASASAAKLSRVANVGGTSSTGIIRQSESAYSMQYRTRADYFRNRLRLLIGPLMNSQYLYHL